MIDFIEAIHATTTYKTELNGINHKLHIKFAEMAKMVMSSFDLNGIDLLRSIEVKIRMAFSSVILLNFKRVFNVYSRVSVRCDFRNLFIRTRPLGCLLLMGSCDAIHFDIMPNVRES